MYELWEDRNVLIDDTAEPLDIAEPAFAAYAIRELLPTSVEELDEPDDNAAHGKMFENEEHPRAPFAGVCVAVGFDGERIYADLPGLAEDDTIYYADIWEVGHPVRGHNTIAFVAMASDRMDDPVEERETMQWLYSRACTLFSEEAETAAIEA